MSANAEPGPTHPSRLAIVDAARGVALIAMFIYHFGWNLAYFRYVGPGIIEDPAWRGFAISIAGSFLFLVGVSLVLATRDGLNWRAFARRLALLVAGAALVTAVTLYLFPTSFIFFGILHSIAACSVLGLLFLRVPLFLVAISAMAVFLAPHFFADPMFNAWGWRWLGLMTYFPETNDYEPILPWFSATLTGILATRVALKTGFMDRLSAWQGNAAPLRLLRWGGRHSLAIYLIHQPILFGLVWLAALIAPAPGFGPVTAERYPGFCQANCEHAGSPRIFCKPFCECLARGLNEQDLMTTLLQDSLTGEQLGEINQLSGQCQANNALHLPNSAD